jgi:hypothetical protein
MQNFGCSTQVGVFVERRFDSGFVADQQEFKAFVAVTRERSTCNHNWHAFITAHRVNGDTRFHRHQFFSLERIRRLRPLRGHYSARTHRTDDADASVHHSWRILDMQQL